MVLTEELQPIIVKNSFNYFNDLVSTDKGINSSELIEIIRDSENKVYSAIASTVTSKKPIYVDERDFLNSEFLQKDVAEQVAFHANKQHSLILSLNHYSSGLVYDDGITSYVTFDAHNDSYIDREYSNYANGSFLAFRKSSSYVLGTNVGTHAKNVFRKRAGQSEDLIEKIPENIILSLDIDSYDKDVTEAYRYDQGTGFDNLVKFFGGKPHFLEQDVLDLSSKIIEGRTVKTIDISEYSPLYDNNFLSQLLSSQNFSSVANFLEKTTVVDFPTVQLLKRYVAHVVNEIDKNK